VGSALAAATRGSDSCARYGGEEFVVVLIGADREVAARVGERHRALVERIPAADLGGPERVTISVGVADHDPAWEDDSTLGLLKRADAALYLAKERGRNRVEISEREAGGDRLHLPMAPLSPIFSHLPRGAE
jgi:diguanylate cyclase (GGDEF)-like protein